MSAYLDDEVVILPKRKILGSLKDYESVRVRKRVQNVYEGVNKSDEILSERPMQAKLSGEVKVIEMSKHYLDSYINKIDSRV